MPLMLYIKKLDICTVFVSPNVYTRDKRVQPKKKSPPSLSLIPPVSA